MNNKDKIKNIYYPLTIHGLTVVECDKSYEGAVVVPDVVTNIVSNTFKDCKGITSVTLPDGLLTINFNLFGGCTGLTSIVIPKHVKLIDDFAFSDCTNLDTVIFSENYIVFAENLKKIGYGAFDGCTSLKHIKLPSSIKEIETYAFRNCRSLPYMVMPRKLEYVGDAFDCDLKLLKEEPEEEESIESPKMARLDEGPFNGVQSLCFADNGTILEKCDRDYVGEVEIPSYVAGIRHHAFAGCKDVTSVIIPHTVKVIANRAFESCSSLEEITIPGSVKIIHECAFHDCDKLKTVVIEKGCKVIGAHAFEGCVSLENVTLPNSLKHIYNFAFSGCTNLKHINVQDSFSGQVGFNAFAGCLDLDTTGLVAPNPCDENDNWDEDEDTCDGCWDSVIDDMINYNDIDEKANVWAKEFRTATALRKHIADYADECKLILDYDDFSVYEIDDRFYYLENSGDKDADNFYEVDVIAELIYNSQNDLNECVKAVDLNTMFDCSVCGENVDDGHISFVWFKEVSKDFPKKDESKERETEKN